MKERLRALIENELRTDITQDKLAQNIGVSQATIQKILFSETKHTLDILQKCANYFQVPVSDLLHADRTDISLHDIAAARNRTLPPADLLEQERAYQRSEKYKIITEVGEILDSGNDDIINALVKNVHEFKRAVETSKRLNVCEAQLAAQKEEMDALRNQVNRLTAPPSIVKESAVS